MNFVSLEFLIFFPVVCLLYWIIPDQKRRWLLLAASYLFYMSWKPLAAGILFLVTLVTFLAAKKIEDSDDLPRKRGWRFVGVTIPLLALILFKNAGFWMVAGISFYTFQSLSYVLDVYAKRIEAERSFSEYALYISFFPQLVAGPIERPGNLLLQLKREKHFQKDQMKEGLGYLVRGFFKKLVIADWLSGTVDRIFAAFAAGSAGGAAGMDVTVCSAWMTVAGAMLFALQIYGDFSGYSDIAKGCAMMLGVRLSDNFDRPYLAKGIGDFWRRWHRTLTSWFTDYVYKPLGGSRRGMAVTCRNIMIVFLLSGIWHGYGGHYLIWGGLHGCFLILERLISGGEKKKIMIPDMVKIAGTFLLVCFSWIFFRAPSVCVAGRMIAALGSGWGKQGILETVKLLGWKLADVIQLLLSLAVLHLLDEKKKPVLEDGQGWILFLTIVFTWFMLLSLHQENAFIYFRF